MGDNYVMLLSSFKRDLKNHYNITMNHQEIKDAIEDVSDYFITFTTKNKTYVIYVNDFVDWSKKDFMEKEKYIKKNYKTIFLILSFEELIYQLY